MHNSGGKEHTHTSFRVSSPFDTVLLVLSFWSQVKVQDNETWLVVSILVSQEDLQYAM